MTKLDNQQIETTIQSLNDLVRKKCKNEKEIAKLLHQLLKNAPGSTVKKRKKFIVEKFPGKGSTNSYLRRMLHAAEFEMTNSLEPGTLKESQARLILEHTKDEALRLDIFKRALEIANTKNLAASHIKKAIDELKKSLLKYKKAPESFSDSDEIESPTMNADSSTNPAKKSKSKQKADGSDSPAEEPVEDNDPFGIDEERAEEIRTKELFQKLKPHFESIADRIAAIDIVMRSLNVWAMCKVFAEYERDEINTVALLELIDPDGDAVQLRGKKSARNPQKLRQAQKRQKQARIKRQKRNQQKRIQTSRK